MEQVCYNNHMSIEYIKAKSIISTNTAPDNGMWFSFDYNMNIYRGCMHGCIYCDSRSECYHIDNFGQVRAKTDAVEMIKTELKKKRRKGIVATGAMSDPYNPFEEKLELTRDALKAIDTYGFGVAIYTKSDLIVRDIDILSSINEFMPVLCCVTITTADDELGKIIEPHAKLSSERFAAIKALSDAGIFTGVLLTPTLPYITDTPENIEAIVDLAKENGASFIYAMYGVTLRDRQRKYFYSKLDESFPGTKNKYIASYGIKYYCESPNSRNLRGLLASKCKSNGILYRMKDIISGYKDGKGEKQISFL